MSTKTFSTAAESSSTNRIESEPLVSIGMPVYNGAEYIRDALDTLLGQSHQHIELLISDDSSTDGTFEICQEYARVDPRIRLVRQVPRLGMLDNFQYVLENSRGPYFMWASQDDYWDLDWIKNNLRGLESGTIVCTASFCTVDQQRRRIHWFSDRRFSSRTGIRAVQIMFSQMNGVLMYGVFDRSKLLEIPGYPVMKRYGLYADNFTVLQAALAGKFARRRDTVMFKRVHLEERDYVNMTTRVRKRSFTLDRVRREIGTNARLSTYYVTMPAVPWVKMLAVLGWVPHFFLFGWIHWRGTPYARKNIG
jgi:glycosyltransferase involved in cell wall biosynthesis